MTREGLNPKPMAVAASDTVGTDRRRVLWVDYAKGWCIILVVMMHSALGVGLAVGATGWLHELVAFAKPFRMPDFFVISGLFLGRAIDRPWREFLDKRVVHFAYFYALWFFIALILKAGDLGIAAPAAFLRAYLWGFIEPFSSMWFIQLLPFFFVATRLCKRVPAPALLAIAVGLHLLAAFHPEGGIYAMSSTLTGLTTVDSFALFFVYFIIGHLFRNNVFNFASSIGARPGAALAGLLLWALLEELSVRSGLPEIPGLTLIFGFAGAFAVVTISALLARSDAAPWLAYCGRHSLVIYLSFFAPMAATRLLLAKTGLAENVGLMSVIVTLVAITAPIILDAAIRNTWFDFLYRRPSWARLNPPAQAIVSS
ncbi:Uncharacterized membrane protein YcfT [Rhizobiales bacterium GAS191]|nr:Uncharacterized membrane protein YcfT [Rhizobiales bacterium GAS191]